MNDSIEKLEQYMGAEEIIWNNNPHEIIELLKKETPEKIKEFIDDVIAGQKQAKESVDIFLEKCIKEGLFSWEQE